jgi:uncharacterized protein (TIGR03435 family)
MNLVPSCRKWRTESLAYAHGSVATSERRSSGSRYANFRKLVLGVTTGTFLCLAGSAASAQEGSQQSPQQTFEVASIKSVQGLTGRIYDFSSSGPRVRYIAYSMAHLIMEAYNVKNYQVTFAPTAVVPKGGEYGDEYYDIEAKAEGSRVRSRNEFRPMLEALLAQRFKLRVHRSTKEMPVYTLITGKNAPTLRKSESDAIESVHIGVNGRNQTITASKCSMEHLAGTIETAFSLERPVLDRTGLGGTYDLKIEATPQPRIGGEDLDLKNVSVFTAVQQQLGLRLEPQKAMIEILVVDYVEKPSAN